MNPQPKYKPITSKRIPLNGADLALLPSPDKVNVSEWIREAIREKAKREQARDLRDVARLKDKIEEMEKK